MVSDRLDALCLLDLNGFVETKRKIVYIIVYNSSLEVHSVWPKIDMI